MLLVLLAVMGCGKEQEAIEIRKIYDSVVDEAIDTYQMLHPLRSSRLGMYGADSSLFTFSKQELKAGKERIKRLLESMSHLKVGRLGEREMDDSILLHHWLKGELFAMDKLENHRRNPLLYCWMIEEALFGLPSRIESPYEGERPAYERRMSKIPQLLENAQALLEKPSEHHVQYAQERLDWLIDSFGDLKLLAESRYGERIDSFDSVRRSIEAFRRFIADELSSRTRGRLILGAENLSYIFLYDEHLDIDLNALAKEAEKSIKTLRNKAAMMRKNLADSEDTKTGPESAGTETLEHVVSRLIGEMDETIASNKAFPGKPSEKPVVVTRRFPMFLRDLPDNPYLAIPLLMDMELAVTHTSCFSRSPCRSIIVASEGAVSLEESELFFQLLNASSAVRPAGIDLCEQCDFVRSLMRSETHRTAWSFHNMEELTRIFPERKQKLDLLLVERMTRDLARMIVVFRLHSGAFTSGAAIDYFAETVGVPETAAEQEVIRASVSPSVAYPGIAMLYNWQMLKRHSESKAVKDPRKAMRRLFLDQNGLPLPILMERIAVD